MSFLKVETEEYIRSNVKESDKCAMRIRLFGCFLWLTFLQFLKWWNVTVFHLTSILKYLGGINFRLSSNSLFWHVRNCIFSCEGSSRNWFVGLSVNLLVTQKMSKFWHNPHLTLLVGLRDFLKIWESGT